MKTVFIILSATLAAFAEWFLAWSVGGITIPLVAFTALFWFWRLPYGTGLILGIFVGGILDLLGYFPFGTYLLAFGGCVVLASISRLYFSDLKSSFTQAVWLTTGLGAFFLMVILAAAGLSKIALNAGSSIGVSWGLAGGIVFWAALLPAAWFAFSRLSLGSK